MSSCVLREGFFLLQFLRRERELLSVNLLFGNFISQLLNNEHCQNCIFDGQTHTKPKQDDIAQGDVLSLFIKLMPKVHSFEQTRDHTCFICCQGDPKSVLLCVHTVRQLLNVQLKTCQTTSERSHTAQNRRQTAVSEFDFDVLVGFDKY